MNHLLPSVKAAPARRRQRRDQLGIALIEALIAVILLAIGLVGTLGLQARAQAALLQADMRAEATMASEKLLGIMSVNQGSGQSNLPLYAKVGSAAPPAVMLDWHDQVMKRMPGALVTVAVSVDSPGMSRVGITIVWQRTVKDAPEQHTVTSYISSSSLPPP